MLEELCDVRYRYAEGIDHRDWALYRSVFCDEVEVSMMVDAISPAPTPRLLDADRWVASVAQLVTGLAATQHCMYNPRASVRSDSAATLTTYMQAEHVLDMDDPTSWYTIGGYYSDRMRRTDEGWRIAGLRLSLFWHRGDPAVLVRARDRARSGVVPVRQELPRP